MRTGDKVRFLHSKGEGIVRKFIDDKNIEVEIEDGFLIPALRSDLVVVHSHDSLSSSTRASEAENSDSHDEGLWFTFLPFNDKTYTLYIVNDSSSEILFTLGEDGGRNYSAISSGMLKPRASVKITDVSISDFDKWPEYIFQCLFFKQGTSILKEPLLKRLRFKAASFFKSKQTVPVLNKEAYAFRLDEVAVHADPKKIVEEMFSTKIPDLPKQRSISKPAKEVDLHIENLVTDFSKMSNAEMLELQLKTFEKNLDNAIAMGMEEIIFIHGVGNGVLRDSIHKILSKNKNIQYFQDAQKQKFGYGATSVRIK